MSRDILKYAGVGLGIVLLVVAIIYISNRGSQIRLNGTIQKVRVQAMDAKSCVVIVDFRFNNPANFPFVVRDAEVYMEDANGVLTKGTAVAAVDAKRVLEYYSKVNPELGPQYNEVLILRDRVEAGQAMDRMICARFEVPEAVANQRRAVRVRVLDVDGAHTDIVEQRETE